MGTTGLRQLLKSLCNNSLWNYAVFWKLKHQNDLILSWEDGYCHHPKPREAVGFATDDIYFGEANEMPTSIQDGESVGYPIGLAVADLSHLQYTFGEGVVGEVARTGNHSWVLLDDLGTKESESNLVPDCPDEWLLQFVLGVKTILLVPVLPYGVLQLGSLEMVAEDLAVVALMKDRFSATQNVVDNVPFNLIRNIQAQSSWSQSSAFMENPYESSAVGLSPMKVERLENIGSITQNGNLLSNLEQCVHLQTIEDPGLNPSEIRKSIGESEIGVPAMCHNGESNTASQSMHTSLVDMVESQMFGLSCLEKEFLNYSQYDSYNMEVFGESFNGFNSQTAGGAAEQLFKFNNVEDTSHNMVTSLFDFPETSELHKALGTAFQRQTMEQLWEPSMCNDDTCSSSGLQKDLYKTINPSWFSRANNENLLEASVGKDDTSSSVSDESGISKTLSKQFPVSCNQLKFEASPPMESDPMTRSHTSMFPARGKISASFTDMRNPLVGNKQQGKGYTSTQPKKEQKLSSSNPRRAKPGNGPKLRPRDRQLIQERVKELRELVPNGGKCSIDGLLDRTVKHMIYLRSVTDQAEKLKCYSYQDQEVPRCNNTSETASGSSSGISRAFELGSDLHSSPIVVEDLEHPGHILIEMLCDEHEVFLEIAQSIRRLELTILKGAMETRSNGLWAHFVVEAPRGFHRMDVFWPLLHLLQRRRSSLSSKI